MGIDELVDNSYLLAYEKGWWEDQDWESQVVRDRLLFSEKLLLMHSEISEALEEVRVGTPYTEIYYSDKGKPEGIPIELADLAIRLGDLCGRYGIDLTEAIRIKHEYNKTRPHRHGGKLS